MSKSTFTIKDCSDIIRCLNGNTYAKYRKQAVKMFEDRLPAVIEKAMIKKPKKNKKVYGAFTTKDGKTTDSIASALTGRTLTESIDYFKSLQNKYIDNEVMLSNGYLVGTESTNDICYTAASRLAQGIINALNTCGGK
jgi:hypothetical protein